ncbi:MAG: pseudouridine synthase [Verrucomicrobiaceae bacterium]|nr:pseudouridine synthase [Verrucomicrobiaceae bacterium]
MRLNRYLSQCGIASRRGAEQIIVEGRVSINGHVITSLATQVEPEDKVIVDGKPVKTELPVVLALNKPKGYICSRGDTHERMTIYDLLPDRFQHLHHVGRLDKESEGLLLMTNRGDLSHRIIHPSQGAEKEYEVVVDQPMTQDTMAKLVKGMPTEEGHAKVERAWLDGAYRCHLVLKQGLKRQIRLMMYGLGYEVERLTRIRIGWLQLRGMQKGSWKQLTPAEVERFFAEEARQSQRERPAPKKTGSRTPRAPRSPAGRPARVESQDDFFDDEAPRRPRSPGARRGPPARDSGPEKRPRGPGARRGPPARDNDSEKRPRGPGARRGPPTRDSDSEKRPRGRTGFGPKRPGKSSPPKGPRRGPPPGRRG